MQYQDQEPNRNEREYRKDENADATEELNDAELESVAGGITWHLPTEPISTPWADGGDI